jgi:anti-sigma factor (TIGR02949 family)
MEHGNCKHLLGNLSEYVDGELGEDLCAEIERHLAGCEDCRIVVDSLRKTIYLVHETSQTRVEVPEDVRSRLFHRLNLDEFIQPPEASNPTDR